MTHKKVWESLLLYSTRNMQPIGVHLDAPRPEGYVAFQDRYEDAQEIAPSEYPDYVFFQYYDLPKKKKESLPDIFTGELALIFVSEAMHDLLTQFNLGKTRFQEVDLREYDQETPYPGKRWFFMHVLEDRKTLIPELSTGLRPVGTSGEAWRMYSEGPNKLAVDPTAANDLDFWMDRSIRSRVFFSGRLKIAIKEFGLNARWLGFRPCKVVV
ncbi:imm11 family protein [Ruegeria meonggei]|uniref:imm11 family protein n=1 Tax=Ruegeria meonggei TaxID=1446476 RepID=UPI00366A857E